MKGKILGQKIISKIKWYWWVVVIVFLAIFLFLPSETSAHPGNTAADGCHYCRTNCDYWGVPWNVRHCHNGYTAPKPVYIPTPTPKPTPTPPVCTINGINFYSENTCSLEEHKVGVKKLYNSLLGRNASDDEVNSWASAEPDIKKIEEQIKQSGEYKQKHPSSTPTVKSTQSPSDIQDDNNIIIWVGVGLGIVLSGILIGYIIGKRRKT